MRTGKLKSLEDLKKMKMTYSVVENGVERPATHADLAPLRDAARAMRAGALVVNGRRVTPEGVWTDEEA